MTSSAVERASSPPSPHLQRRGRTRTSRFLRALVAVTALIHLPVGFAVAHLAVTLGLPMPSAVGWVWACGGVLLFAGRARAGVPDRRRWAAIVRVLDIPYFIHWCAALWTVVSAAVATVVWLVMEAIGRSPVRPPAGVLMWSYLSGLVVCGYGVLARRRRVRVVERPVRLRGLDPRLNGFRIAHLSDLHIGSLTPRSWGLAWSELANDRRPDITVVTGDMVTSGTDFHEDVADVIASLRARYGVFASMGNHDYFGEGEPLVRLLCARGVRVLRNEGVEVSSGQARIWLAAVDDTWTRREDLRAALRGRPAGATAVLLAHDPALFDRAADARVDLVLSGHTHGGQVAMPFLSRRLNLARLLYRYTLGFYRRGGSVLFVSPGLGTTGPPIRLGVAPEVTILVLRPW